MRCYIFDLDGTLCDVGHRLHFIRDPNDKQPGLGGPGRPSFKPDWDAFFAACVDDPPISALCKLASDLIAAGERVLFVSGRSDAVRAQTRDWLHRNVALDVPFGGGSSWLLMRAAGDHRPDHVVKGELLDQILAGGWEPIMAFDDRDQVVKMWRARGIPCAQVAEGDF